MIHVLSKSYYKFLNVQNFSITSVVSTFKISLTNVKINSYIFSDSGGESSESKATDDSDSMKLNVEGNSIGNKR